MIRRFMEWLIHQSWFRWSCAAVFGLLDLCTSTIYRLFRDDDYRWVRSWQEDRLCLTDRVPSAPPRKSWAGQTLPFQVSDCRAEFLAVFCCFLVDAKAVEVLLERGLIRRDAPGVPPGKHPAIFMFGMNQGLHRDFVPVNGVSYLESAICVPEIYVESEDIPHCHIFRLWLNRLYPTVLGWLVGYPKVLRWVNAEEKGYEVRRLFSGRREFCLRFDFAGDPAERGPLKGATEWRNWLAQPHLNLPIYGGHVVLEYDLEWHRAVPAPVDVQLEILDKDIPLLPPGTYHFPMMPPAPALEGAFVARVPFELTCPLRETAFVGAGAPPNVLVHKTDAPPRTRGAAGGS